MEPCFDRDQFPVRGFSGLFGTRQIFRVSPLPGNVPQDAQHLGSLAGYIHARHRILENTGGAVDEMQFAFEEMLLHRGCIARPVIFPQLFALVGMKQARHIHAFEQGRSGVQHAGKCGVDLDDHAAGIGEKHGLTRSLPNGAELRLRLQ